MGVIICPRSSISTPPSGSSFRALPQREQQQEHNHKVDNLEYNSSTTLLLSPSTRSSCSTNTSSSFVTTNMNPTLFNIDKSSTAFTGGLVVSSVDKMNYGTMTMMMMKQKQELQHQHHPQPSLVHPQMIVSATVDEVKIYKTNTNGLWLKEFDSPRDNDDDEDDNVRHSQLLQIGCTSPHRRQPELPLCSHFLTQSGCVSGYGIKPFPLVVTDDDEEKKIEEQSSLLTTIDDDDDCCSSVTDGQSYETFDDVSVLTQETLDEEETKTLMEDELEEALSVWNWNGDSHDADDDTKTSIAPQQKQCTGAQRALEDTALTGWLSLQAIQKEQDNNGGSFSSGTSNTTTAAATTTTTAAIW